MMDLWLLRLSSYISAGNVGNACIFLVFVCYLFLSCQKRSAYCLGPFISTPNFDGGKSRPVWAVAEAAMITASRLPSVILCKSTNILLSRWSVHSLGEEHRCVCNVSRVRICQNLFRFIETPLFLPIDIRRGLPLSSHSGCHCTHQTCILYSHGLITQVGPLWL